MVARRGEGKAKKVPSREIVLKKEALKRLTDRQLRGVAGGGGEDPPIVIHHPH